jgi:ABC-type spermidine/putrescine transport system permease subunit II
MPVYTGVFLLYLVIPIAVMIVYSFNASHSHLPNVTFKWQGFTLQWYREWNGIPGLTGAFFLSLRLARKPSFEAKVPERLGRPSTG